MIIGVPREVTPGEKRIPVIPETVKKLTGLKGVQVWVEKDIGKNCHYDDAQYKKAGAAVKTRADILSKSDILVRIRKPKSSELAKSKKDSLHIGYLDPFNEKALLGAFAKSRLRAISMEMIPRSTIAQKMDVLSSQASLAGYVAVIKAADTLNQVFPMMMTPAGTISPSRVFIIGAGVAGLQAIATAKRIGARVEAFDTRPVVAEQVESLGAKFIKVDLGETGQTAQGYAKALTDEQIKKQREAMEKVSSLSDVVITTAQLFGRKAPIIVTKKMLESMKPGSVVVDLAVESGGNVEGSKLGQTVDYKGVKIIGIPNLPGEVNVHSSQMFSSNVYNFLSHFYKEEEAKFVFDKEDEIYSRSLITEGGDVVHELFKSDKPAVKKAGAKKAAVKKPVAKKKSPAKKKTSSAKKAAAKKKSK